MHGQSGHSASFNDTIRSTVEAPHGIYLADLDKDVSEILKNGIIEKLFLDYCHFTEKGHKLIAAKLLSLIQKTVGQDMDLAQIDRFIQTDDMASRMDIKSKAYEHYAAGMTYFNNMMLAEAEKAYLEALKLEQIPGAYSNLATIYELQGNYEQSKGMYLQSLKINPEHLLTLIKLGDIYFNEGDLNEAEAYYRKAITINSYSPEAYAALGDIEMRRKNYSKAIANYNDALRLGENSGRLRNSLAGAYLAEGEKEKALQNWKAALQFNPYDQKTRALIKQYSREM